MVTPATSSTKPFLKRVHLLFLLTGILFSHQSLTQSEQDLRRLIFEAVALPQDEASAPPADIAAIPSETADSQAEEEISGKTTEEPVEETASDGQQTIPPANLQADIARYRAQINDLIRAENTYSHGLREQYDSLATLLQQNGEHEAAVAALESAMHIDRVNNGLFTLEQIPLVEKIIASHAALGNVSEVNDYHGYLYYIQQKSYGPDDPRLLAAKEAWADWNVDSFLKDGIRSDGSLSFSAGLARSRGTDYVAIQDPRTGMFNYVPRSQLPFVLNPNGMASPMGADYYRSSLPYAVSPELLVDERLRTARDLYKEIIEARPAEGEGSDDYSSERKLANIAFTVKKQMDEIESSENMSSLNFARLTPRRTTSYVVTRGYTDSTETLEQIAQTLETAPDSDPVETARAYIDLGDWHTGFERLQRGEEAYGKAWRILQGAGMDEAAIQEIFAPEPLIPIPAFATHAYSRELYGISPETELSYKGYLDVALGVDRFGRAKGMNILQTSPETPQRIRNILMDYLRKHRMRPAIVDGKPVERSDLKIRYYYTY